MRRSSSFAVLAAVALGATLVTASPANATTQSLYGTTVQVIATPSGNSLLGSTAYVPAGGGSLTVNLGAVLGFDVLASLRLGATELSSCTVTTGTTQCSMPVSGLAAGANAVTMRFTGGASTVDYTGTLFAVTNPQPTVGIEWQDAAGTWVDASFTSALLRGATALRCVVTNNSNAPLTFGSFQGEAFFLVSGSQVTPITGTLAAGATSRTVIWSGQASVIGSASCSGSVTLRDGTGTGNGSGGGVIALGGTVDVDNTPAPGRTVTITANGLTPPVVGEYTVLLDGVEVSGSPVAAPGPGYGFTLPVTIPTSLAPGQHMLSVVAIYGDVRTAIAAFPFTVAGPQLAATGSATDAAPMLGGALLLLGAGVLLLAARRRASTR